jgi:hypothetical protein
MDASISLQDVANIVTFIASGYFAIQVYSLIYAKRERDFSKLLIESVVYSLPLVYITNVVWQNVFSQTRAESLSLRYSFLLLFISFGSGAILTYLRVHWPIKDIAASVGLVHPMKILLRHSCFDSIPRIPTRM